MSLSILVSSPAVLLQSFKYTFCMVVVKTKNRQGGGRSRSCRGRNILTPTVWPRRDDTKPVAAFVASIIHTLHNSSTTANFTLKHIQVASMWLSSECAGCFSWDFGITQAPQQNSTIEYNLWFLFRVMWPLKLVVYSSTLEHVLRLSGFVYVVTESCPRAVPCQCEGVLQAPSATGAGVACKFGSCAERLLRSRFAPATTS